MEVGVEKVHFLAMLLDFDLCFQSHLAARFSPLYIYVNYVHKNKFKFFDEPGDGQKM